MKILTWNINGLRAVTREKSLKELLNCLGADVICFQETKVTRDMLEEAICIVDGYNAYFSYSRGKTGYSGVVTFCKDSIIPCGAEEGLTSLMNPEPSIGCYGNTDDFMWDELLKLDNEGRSVLTEHMSANGDKVVIINVYCPRADMENDERIQFKLKFYNLLQRRVEALLASGRHVIVLGDINAAHKEIDHCDPGRPEEFKAYPGRSWLDQFLVNLSTIQPVSTTEQGMPHDTKDVTVSKLDRPVQFSIKDLAHNPSALSDNHEMDGFDKEHRVSGGSLLVDSFRYFHPTQKEAYTNWSTSTGARQTNYGRRLDYVFADVSLIQHEFTGCIIQPEVEGSDHCPVVASLRRSFVAASKPPALCSRFMPEFAGRQQKLVAFFTKKTSKASSKSLQAKTEQSKKKEQELGCADSEMCSSSAPKETLSTKRPATCSSNSKAKRAKMAQSVKQNSLLQFFGRKQSSNTSMTSVGSLLSNSGFSDKESNLSSGDSDSKPDSQELSGFSTSSESPNSTPNSSDSLTKFTNVDRKAEVAAWKNILKGPSPAPLCPGHNEPCVLRTVKKKGTNYGRQFYCCARPEGHLSNKEARCKYFKWIK